MISMQITQLHQNPLKTLLYGEGYMTRGRDEGGRDEGDVTRGRGCWRMVLKIPSVAPVTPSPRQTWVRLVILR